jgi:hypothetical protein
MSNLFAEGLMTARRSGRVAADIQQDIEKSAAMLIGQNDGSALE